MSDFKQISPVSELSFWVIIKVIGPGNEIVKSLRWDDLRYETRLKWDWYFRYRAALLQVENPRAEVKTLSGSQPATGKTQQQLIMQKLKAKRAKITGYKNKLELAKTHWNSLFPIEQDSKYIQAIEKIQKLENEIRFLENANQIFT